MVAPINASQAETQQAPSRRENAVRVAKFGLLAGAVLGMFGVGGAGGGLLGALKMGGMFALGSAVLGAVAGNKLNPLLDRVTSLLPGKGGKQQAASAAVEAPVQQKEVQAPEAGVAQSHTMEVSNPYGSKVTVQTHRPISELAPELLAGARANSEESLAKAGEGMSADAQAGLPDQWQSRDAAGKRVTHGGSAALQ